MFPLRQSRAGSRLTTCAFGSILTLETRSTRDSEHREFPCWDGASPNISVSVDVGSTVGDYEVLARLGAGGVGEVFKVRHSITGRIEAIKVLLPDHAQDGAQVDRFLREVKIQANLSHPNVASVLNAFRAGKELVMVLEFVEGESLDKIIARGRLPLKNALSFAFQALSALTYAHAAGVTHRDVKPENMLVTARGVLKVTDFGLAKTATDPRLTATGDTLGSLYYMSPEQVKGVGALDARTDIYSMGVVLYELITGVRPFGDEHPYELMKAHVEQQPQPPVELDPSLPQTLNDAVLKAMEKKPEARFESAAQFGRAVEAATRARLRAGVTIPKSKADGKATGRQPAQDSRIIRPANEGSAFSGVRRLAALAAVFVALVALLAWLVQRRDPKETVAAPVSAPRKSAVTSEIAVPAAAPDSPFGAPRTVRETEAPAETGKQERSLSGTESEPVPNGNASATSLAAKGSTPAARRIPETRQEATKEELRRSRKREAQRKREASLRALELP